MQTFSSMQRSISHYNPLELLLLVALFVVYSSLSSIYPILPPLFAVLFLFFAKALEQHNYVYVVFVSVCLVTFEINNGYILFSSIIYLYLIYKFILPQISQNFSCKSCMNISYVLFSYFGYFLFLTLLSNVFLLESPNINYYIVYYIVIEFFLVSML